MNSLHCMNYTMQPSGIVLIGWIYLFMWVNTRMKKAFAHNKKYRNSIFYIPRYIKENAVRALYSNTFNTKIFDLFTQ